ncbi:hypothetical protein [Rhodococcus qingshengii]|uniref:hypothetical protein n=1 Tax=Rhodococcus qingshengii TaxID=334542 RepID=UPI00279BE204|nr:hypothetical protein PI247_31070 [Rhodococcus qingshengii]
MTGSVAASYAFIAFVVGYAAGKVGNRTRQAAAPVSESDATRVRTVIRENGLAHGVKMLREIRPDMSLREANRAVSALQ